MTSVMSDTNHDADHELLKPQKIQETLSAQIMGFTG